VNVELITKPNLEQFKSELLTEIQRLVQFGRIGSFKQPVAQEQRGKKTTLDFTWNLAEFVHHGTLSFTKVGSIMYYKLEEINSCKETNHERKCASIVPCWLR
jgi:hypothetical protein